MGIFKAIGDFLFGKDPDIFDDKGQIAHKFPEEKWKQWNNRIKSNPDYDWHQHGAMKRASQTSTSKSDSKNN